MAIMKFKNADGTVEAVTSPNDHVHENKDILNTITSEKMLNKYYIYLKGEIDTSGTANMFSEGINLHNESIVSTMMNRYPITFLFLGAIKDSGTQVFSGTLVGQMQWSINSDNSMSSSCSIEYQGKRFIFKPSDDKATPEKWTVSIEQYLTAEEIYEAIGDIESVVDNLATLNTIVGG
jgi:hypothetical protein